MYRKVPRVRIPLSPQFSRGASALTRLWPPAPPARFAWRSTSCSVGALRSFGVCGGGTMGARFCTLLCVLLVALAGCQARDFGGGASACSAHCGADAGAPSGLVDAEVCPDSAPAPDGSTTNGAPLSSSVCTPPPPGLRLVAPISASTVTSARPLLRLATVAGSTTDVQICADRACTQVVWQTTSAAAQVSPTVDLAPGYWFWRARLTGPSDFAWTSSWLFRVRRRSPGYAPLANTAESTPVRRLQR